MTAVPALDRIVAIVERLANGPPATLSGLCRELSMPKATAHGLLAALCEQGWVWRDTASKEYAVGPALTVLAARLTDRPRLLAELARPHMEHLAESSGARVVASAVVGDEIVMLAVAGEERPFGTALRPGQRLPLAPPIGTVFLAWAGARMVERWLSRRGPAATDGDVQRWQQAVSEVRRRGYCIALDSSMRHLLGQAVSAGVAPEALIADLDHGEYVLLDVQPGREYAVSTIAAPVFDGDGAVALAVSLFDLPDPLPASRIAELADALVATAAAITKELHHD